MDGFHICTLDDYDTVGIGDDHIAGSDHHAADGYRLAESAGAVLVGPRRSDVACQDG